MKELAIRLVGLAEDMEATDKKLMVEVNQAIKMKDEYSEEERSQAAKRKDLVAREKAVKEIEDIAAEQKLAKAMKTEAGEMKAAAQKELDDMRDLKKQKNLQNAERTAELDRRQKGLDSKDERIKAERAKLTQDKKTYKEDVMKEIQARVK